MKLYLPALSLLLPCLLWSTLLAQEQTTLRVIDKPKGTHTHSALGQPFLSHVEAEVRNVGKIDAKNVQVVATLPNGARVNLEGPLTIAPNKKSVYTLAVNVHNPPDKAITAEARCENCRNR